MPDSFRLEKWVWSDDDFQEMGWHDCHVYALAFPRNSYELALDIDYCFQWVEAASPENSGFWVAPATLVFDNVHEVKIDFPMWTEVEIDSIEREKPTPVAYEYVNRLTELLWTVNCHQGDIVFRSTGFKLFIRSAPQFSTGICLEIENRAGISFARSHE